MHFANRLPKGELMVENRIKVVLIDDDKDDYFLIKSLLNEVRGFSYSIQWFADSRSGIEAIKEQNADIYLVDYRLDSKTGLDVLDEVKKHEITKSIILLTGKGDHYVDMEAMSKGASDFLSKEQITSELLERSIRYSIKQAQDQEQIKENAQLRMEKELSDKANNTKSLFLANMSHEIRTPLGAMMGFADLALEASSESEKVEFLQSIKRNGDNLLQLINDILDLSKVEAGQLQTAEGYFDWREVILNTIKSLRPTYKSKDLDISFKCSPDIPKLLGSDTHRLNQIIFNVLGNAIKFTDKGSIMIECGIENTLSIPQLVIDISDTGPGITKEDQVKLFKPFQQLSALTSRRYGGTGLGLDLSKKLARMLGGDLTLKSSEPGVGSCFRIELPAKLKSPDKNDTVVTSKDLSLPNNSSKAIRVLLVEDAIDNQTIVKYYLKNTKFDIDCANDGQLGVEKALFGNYDIVLMDIQMPNLDGYEATRSLRESGFVKPIIALTASALNSEREKALKQGFSAFLTKPIQKNTLVSMLNNFFVEKPNESHGLSR